MELDTRCVILTCNSDMTEDGIPGFTWPESGPVECPKGYFFSGCIWNETDKHPLIDWSPSAKWLVVEVPTNDLSRGLGYRFHRGNVLYCGTQCEAIRISLSRA